MRQKTDLEKATQRGEIRLEIVTMRSFITPRWWEFKKRYRWWRLQHHVRSDRRKLSPETQMALAWAEEALERELLYGNGEEV